jgi:hypothetical protein
MSLEPGGIVATALMYSNVHCGPWLLACGRDTHREAPVLDSELT